FMNTFDTLKTTFGTTDMVLTSYVSDLSDDDLMSRPGAGCNHIAWQLGHLISSESNLLNMIKEGSGMELPDGFAEKHSKETTGSDDATQFCSKDEYLELYSKTRANSLAVLEGLSADEMNAPAPDEFKNFCPTMGAVAVLVATHPMMHVGQFVPVRRALDKPILI
ncbi:MAG: DinB family protein, partial [Planctomycetaceae bacterium]